MVASEATRAHTRAHTSRAHHPGSQKTWAVSATSRRACWQEAVSRAPWLAVERPRRRPLDADASRAPPGLPGRAWLRPGSRRPSCRQRPKRSRRRVASRRRAVSRELPGGPRMAERHRSRTSAPGFQGIKEPNLLEKAARRAGPGLLPPASLPSVQTRVCVGGEVSADSRARTFRGFPLFSLQLIKIVHPYVIHLSMTESKMEGNRDLEVCLSTFFLFVRSQYPPLI